MSARSLNKIQLIGNLTRDPELRYTPKGTAVCSFGVATNRSYTPSDATEPVEDVDFHNVVVWAKLAELCSQLLHKGDKVFIEGRMNYQEWEDQQSGTKRRRAEIVARDMILLSSKYSRGSSAPPAPAPSAPSALEQDQGPASTDKTQANKANKDQAAAQKSGGKEEVKEGEVPF